MAVRHILEIKVICDDCSLEKQSTFSLESRAGAVFAGQITLDLWKKLLPNHSFRLESEFL